MALSVPEEGKLLSEALNTVKIQVQLMKRNLVRAHPLQTHSLTVSQAFSTGIGSVDGCPQKCQSYARRTQDLFAFAKAVL